MAFAAYICKNTGEIQYAFEIDAEDRLVRCPCGCKLSKLPPNPTVVTALKGFQSEFPQLDSIHTADELDRVSRLEAEREEETKAYQKGIIQH